MMKKLSLLLVLSLLCLAALVGCGHTHAYTPGNPSVATCTEASVVRYTCTCGDYYDHEVDPALGHSMTKTEGVAATCDTDGNLEYYTCSRCEKHYTDEVGTTELQSDALITPAGHKTVHHPTKAPVRFEDGHWAYWECTQCEKLFADAGCSWEIALEDQKIPSSFNIPDFVVEVEGGREPVVLQLTDPQFTNTADMEALCYCYIRETIEATKPDFIIVTGDLVYGKYDPTGELLTSFITFMDSFQIPWAPIFGNHDNESEMGVDWQCDQLEASEYCLFKQRDLTGNGNYSVGIASGDSLVRVFYMLDSNGCGSPSTASAAKVKTSAGFGQDQIDWYTSEILSLRELEPDIKISFAFHIQIAIFGKAIEKYADDAKIFTDQIYRTYPKVWIDKLAHADEDDFGIIGAEVKGAWDTDNKIWNALKSLGVDSIFVGHEHCNGFSIEYEGVRLQYGQKSSEYDRYNWIRDGVMGSGWFNDGWNAPEGATALMGGSVIPLAEDGTILKGYIYLCGEIPEYNP